jgi:gamma-glutamylcyclotransferase (GGCT)/AIG2-like uncharacterized protein YtfP
MSRVIFVYGTLKRGGSNHRHLQNAKYLGDAETTRGYRMYDAGGYPALVRDTTGTVHIPGELWEVDDRHLARLDRFEGTHEGLYHRSPITLATPHDRGDVDAYFYGRDVAGLRDIGARWEE